jgi:hypothetical protein
MAPVAYVAMRSRRYSWCSLPRIERAAIRVESGSSFRRRMAAASTFFSILTTTLTRRHSDAARVGMACRIWETMDRPGSGTTTSTACDN